MFLYQKSKYLFVFINDKESKKENLGSLIRFLCKRRTKSHILSYLETVNQGLLSLKNKSQECFFTHMTGLMGGPWI